MYDLCMKVKKICFNLVFIESHKEVVKINGCNQAFLKIDGCNCTHCPTKMLNPCTFHLPISYRRIMAIPSNKCEMYWSPNSNSPGPFFSKVPLSQSGIFPVASPIIGLLISFADLKISDCSLGCGVSKSILIFSNLVQHTKGCGISQCDHISPL